MSELLARRKTAGIFEPENYVPGDDEAMDHLELQMLDRGHVLFLEDADVPDGLRTPFGMLVNLSELSIPQPPTNVFGSVYIVPDNVRRCLQLVGICSPVPSAMDLADLRNRVPGSRLVRAQQVCAQLGVTMKNRRTRLGQNSLTVELDLSTDDLAMLRDGFGRNRPLDQVEDFGRTLGQVSDALQGNDPSRSSAGCYVATAVYGSYDAPEVVVLRRYRDIRLSRSKLGRALIRSYYVVSPPIVRRLRRASRTNRLVRVVLDRVVARLESGSPRRGSNQHA